MARIRSIKPEFWSSEQVMECSTTARLLFIGLWNFCDDAGNHTLSIKTIKAEIFPADEIDLATIQRLLDELSSNELIVYYAHENKHFLHVTGWQHQKIEKPTVKHPPYNPEKSVPSRRPVADQSTPERRGEESIGEESIGEEGSAEGDQSQTDLLGETDIPDSLPDEISVVVETFNRLLPNCQRVSVLNDKRRKRITAVCKLARKVCRQQGWPYEPRAFWSAFWAECDRDPWLSGRKPHPNRPTWKQSIDLLLEEDRFARIMDQAIAAALAEDAA